MLLPEVRYLIVCDRADTSENVHIVNPIATIRSDNSLFPFARQLCIYALMVGCRGELDFGLQIRHAESDEVVWTYPRERKYRLENKPLRPVTIVFNGAPEFPEDGIYWVELQCNGQLIAQQPLRVR